jgi:hypothetical protein
MCPERDDNNNLDKVHKLATPKSFLGSLTVHLQPVHKFIHIMAVLPFNCRKQCGTIYIVIDINETDETRRSSD